MPRTKTSRTSNGEGSVYYSDTKKKWFGDIMWTDSAGQRHRKSFSGKKQAIVKEKMDAFKRELLMQTDSPANDSITFKDYCEQWMVNKQINKLKPSSYDRKACSLENQVYPIIGDIPIEALSHSDVQNMVNTLRDNDLSYSSIKKAVEAVSGCMRDYRIQTNSKNNPTEGIELPENKRVKSGEVKFFDAEARKKICEAAIATYSNGVPIYRLGSLVTVLMYTGMRIGELQALTWDDVDLEAKTVSITKNAVLVRDRAKDAKHKYKLVNQSSTKTNTTRVIPLSESALAAFKKLQSVTGGGTYVLATESGKQVSLRNIQRMFAQILERAGVEHPCKRTHDDAEDVETMSAGVHILRHTFASMLFQNGCEVKVVSDLLGHSNTKTTENIYIHLIQEQKVKAIQNIDKFTN